MTKQFIVIWFVHEMPAHISGPHKDAVEAAVSAREIVRCLSLHTSLTRLALVPFKPVELIVREANLDVCVALEVGEHRIVIWPINDHPELTIFFAINDFLERRTLRKLELEDSVPNKELVVHRGLVRTQGGQIVSLAQLEEMQTNKVAQLILTDTVRLPLNPNWEAMKALGDEATVAEIEKAANQPFQQSIGCNTPKPSCQICDREPPASMTPEVAAEVGYLSSSASKKERAVFLNLDLDDIAAIAQVPREFINKPASKEYLEMISKPKKSEESSDKGGEEEE